MTAVLAIDFGGSKILACLVQNGRVLDEKRIPTPRDGGADAWMDAIQALAEPWEQRFTLVGIAVTGLVLKGHWHALNPETLPVPQGFRLEAELTRRLRVPVTALNDAQAAAWGEHVAGAGQGVADMVFVTLSTGIGGGVIVNGKLLMGRHGMAGSIGQMRLQADLRIEDLASGSGIAARADEAGHPADAERVFAAAAQGEAWATEIRDRAVDTTATLFRNLQFLYDSTRIVVGGGVGMSPGHLERICSRLAPLADLERPEIVLAQLGVHAGILGIADLALREAAATREEQSL